MPITAFVMSPFHCPSSLADLHVEHSPDPTAAAVVTGLHAFCPRIGQPQRALLADSERHAVGLKRKNPVRAVDVLGREIAGVAVDRDEADLHLRRLDAAKHLAEQRTFECGRGPEFGGRRPYRALLKPEQHGAIEGESLLEIGLLKGELTVFLGIKCAPLALADRPAHGEQNHVLRRLLLLGGYSWQSAERRDEGNKDRAHGMRTGR